MFLLNTSAVISIEKSRKREIKIIEKGNFFYGFLFLWAKGRRQWWTEWQKNGTIKELFDKEKRRRHKQ